MDTPKSVAKFLLNLGGGFQELSQMLRISVLCFQPLLSGKAAPARAFQGTKGPISFQAH